MALLDVSFPIRDRMPGFPGDPTVRVVPVRRIAEGAGYNLSSLSMSSHTGTHVDPPFHFVDGAPPVDAIALDRLNGPAFVLDARSEGLEIGPAPMARLPPGTRRVLLRTTNSERWDAEERFFAEYAALTPAGAEELLRRDVDVVGIDALSIERDPEERFPVHHRILGSGALIIEGLRLSRAAEGAYTLHCLPLRVAGGDGGPCRAALGPA